jgi:hypothetical protein
MKYTPRAIPIRSTFSVMSAEVDVTREQGMTVERFLCITDMDDGMSVTNDIEAVLAHLVAEGVLKPGMRVIYRDTEKIWDEVVIDQRCHFVTFAPLRATSRDVAITLAVSR